MKLVAGILITLAALTSHAQSNNCNIIKLEKEARHYMAKIQEDIVDIQPCLEIVVQKEIASRKMQRNQAQEGIAVANILADILAEIRQVSMAALVKCESTGTPGCQYEDSVLEKDADTKNADIQKQRAEGSRDW